MTAYLVRAKSFKHSKTRPQYEKDDSDNHHNQGKHGLRVIYT